MAFSAFQQNKSECCKLTAHLKVILSYSALLCYSPSPKGVLRERIALYYTSSMTVCNKPASSDVVSELLAVTAWLCTELIYLSKVRGFACTRFCVVATLLLKHMLAKEQAQPHAQQCREWRKRGQVNSPVIWKICVQSLLWSAFCMQVTAVQSHVLLACVINLKALEISRRIGL